MEPLGKKNGKKPVVNTGIKVSAVKVNISTDAIAKKAYELYEKRGRQPGFEHQDWIEARKILEAGA